MYMVMGIWLKDWVDLTFCHCFTIGFGIMSNLSVTWGGLFCLFKWEITISCLTSLNLVFILDNTFFEEHTWCWLVIAWSLVTWQAFIFHSYLDLCQGPNSGWWKAVRSYVFIHLHSGFVWKAILTLDNLLHHEMTLVLSVIKPLRISQPCTLHSSTDSIWTPHGLHESIWTPHGLHLKRNLTYNFIQNPSGLHSDSRWNPSGLQMEFTYSILSSCICTYIWYTV